MVSIILLVGIEPIACHAGEILEGDFVILVDIGTIAPIGFVVGLIVASGLEPKVGEQGQINGIYNAVGFDVT